MKNTRKRKYVFSNVKKNKEADKNSASKSGEIFNLDNEIVIGLTPLPEPKMEKQKKNKKKKQEDELDFSFKKPEKKSGKQLDNNKKNSKGTAKIKKEKNKKQQRGKEKINTKKQENKKVSESKKKVELPEVEIAVKTDSNKNVTKTKNHKVKINKNLPKPVNNKQKGKKHFFKIAKWTTLLVILLGGFIYFLLSPVFNIKSIIVKSNDQISNETIISLSNISIDQNMFKINKSDSIKKIKENAYIESVTIKRKLCDTIEISVVERYTTFMMRIGNGYAYINNQGYILEVSSETANVPMIEGYETSVEDIKPGNRICVNDLEKLETVLQIMENARSNEIADMISAIDITNDSNYKIIFATEDKLAYIGDCTMLGTRMLYVKTILEKEIGNSGEIFVDMDLNNEYPFFREKV